MADDEQLSVDPIDHNPWFTAAIRNAKDSALPLLIRSLMLEDHAAADIDESVANAVAVVELCLLAVTEVTAENLQRALRMFAEPFGVTIGVAWETIADAILGTLEWSVPDPKKWALIQ